MTITNGYITLAAVKVALGGISDTTDDADIERAVEAASRNIDDFCNRRFWQDPTVATRYYTATHSGLVHTDDISTTVGLVVSTDPGDDGTYEVTWTVDTDFRLAPLNAASDGEPWTQIKRLARGSYSFPTREGNVKVVAKFGWAAVPKAIEQACLTQSVRLFKRKDSPFGIAGSTTGIGEIRLMAKLDPDVENLIRVYRKLAVI